MEGFYACGGSGGLCQCLMPTYTRQKCLLEALLSQLVDKMYCGTGSHRLPAVSYICTKVHVFLHNTPGKR